MMKNGISALTLAVLAGVAHADGDYLSPTDERVRLSLGFTHVTSNTSFQVDGTQGQPGTEVNGESQLGLDHSDFEPTFQATVRVAERQRLRFDYFTLDRTGNQTITGAPIAFRDAALQTGDPVQTDLSLRILSVTYGYSFWHSETLEIAGTIGINETEISARARVQTPAHHVDQSENQAGPFPTPGIDATWVASRRFYFDGRAQYLRVSVDHLDGSLGIFELDAFYRFRPNVSFALGYNSVKASLSSTQASEAGFFDLNTKGPEFIVRVAF